MGNFVGEKVIALLGQSLGFIVVHHVSGPFKPVVHAVLELVNTLFHFSRGEAAVIGFVTHFPPPIFVGEAAADDAGGRLDVTPEFGVVGSGRSDKNAAGPGIKSPGVAGIGCFK